MGYEYLLFLAVPLLLWVRSAYTLATRSNRRYYR